MTGSARRPHGQPNDELLSAQLKRLHRRLQQTDAERRRVVDLYQMQAIELPGFQTRHREVIDRHRQLEQEREALVRQSQELAVNNRLARRVETFASRVRQGIDALDFEQRQRLVRLLVEEVRVTGAERSDPPAHPPGRAFACRQRRGIG